MWKSSQSSQEMIKMSTWWSRSWRVCVNSRGVLVDKVTCRCVGWMVESRWHGDRVVGICKHKMDINMTVITYVNIRQISQNHNRQVSWDHNGYDIDTIKQNQMMILNWTMKKQGKNRFLSLLRNISAHCAKTIHDRVNIKCSNHFKYSHTTFQMDVPYFHS